MTVAVSGAKEPVFFGGSGGHVRCDFVQKEKFFEFFSENMQQKGMLVRLYSERR